MRYKSAGNDAVDTQGEEVFDLLRPGQQVETPLGSGVIKEIGVQAARYGDRIELEPPVVTVMLDNPGEGVPDEVVVCMCKLGLGNAKHEAILQKEFSRLWPPVTDDVPKDVHMLMDLNKEQDELDKIRSRFERGADATQRVASIALRHHKQHQLYRDYVTLATRTVDPEIKEICKIKPGIVLAGLEGVDLDNESVVLQVVPAKDEQGNELGHSIVQIYDPKSDTVRQLDLSHDSNAIGYDGEEATGYSPTVYDPLRVDSPELHPIRILPNTYLPRNPNYPSSITDTVWRPTVRMTPIRFYNTREGGFDRGEEHNEDGYRNWPPTGVVNYPTSDTVNPPEKSKPRKRGKDTFDPTEQSPDMGVDVDVDLESAAKQFWAAYQQAREQKIPGGSSTLDLDILDFADIYAGQQDDDFNITQILNYMVQIGMLNEYMLNKYLMRSWGRQTGLDTRTHYHKRP